MKTLKAKDLTLTAVHNLLGIRQKVTNTSFDTFLCLEELTVSEKQEIQQICNDFYAYLSAERVLEGLVKALTTFPLMRLAGFYRPPIKISLEQDIAEIEIDGKDTVITGRLDILSVNKDQLTSADIPFWILVIESKNSGVTTFMGLPQLLRYAYPSLEHQNDVWGLVTNGVHYQFVYLQQGSPPNYHLLPELNLMNPVAASQLLQVLKAICKLQYTDQTLEALHS